MWYLKSGSDSVPQLLQPTTTKPKFIITLTSKLIIPKTHHSRNIVRVEVKHKGSGESHNVLSKLQGSLAPKNPRNSLLLIFWGCFSILLETHCLIVSGHSPLHQKNQSIVKCFLWLWSYLCKAIRLKRKNSWDPSPEQQECCSWESLNSHQNISH